MGLFLKTINFGWNNFKMSLKLFPIEIKGDKEFKKIKN